MAKFIKFNIKDSSTPANEKAHLLDVDNIGDISWDGTNKVTIVLRSPAGGNSQAAGIAGRVATIEVNFVKKLPIDLTDVKFSCETPKPSAPPSDFCNKTTITKITNI